ncbi:MAG: acyl carrier protein [Rhizomicrobium sp.]
MITEKDVRAAIGRVRENFDANAVPIDADLGDAGLDSLDHASLLLDLHESTGVEFPEDATGLMSIQAILQFAKTGKI